MSSNNDHQHTPAETIADSFPASDPPSSLPNPDEHDAPGRGADDEKAE